MGKVASNSNQIPMSLKPCSRFETTENSHLHQHCLCRESTHLIDYPRTDVASFPEKKTGSDKLAGHPDRINHKNHVSWSSRSLNVDGIPVQVCPFKKSSVGLEPSRKMETRVCNLLFTIGLTMFSLPNPPNNERTQKCGHKAPD